VIGAKALTALALAIGGGFALSTSGLLRAERWAAVAPETLFWAAFCAAVVGAILFRLWRLGAPSERYLRVATRPSLWAGEAHFVGGGRLRLVYGQNAGDAFDLPVSVVAALAIQYVIPSAGTPRYTDEAG
jgi:hypothetical protein